MVVSCPQQTAPAAPAPERPTPLSAFNSNSRVEPVITILAAMHLATAAAAGVGGHRGIAGIRPTGRGVIRHSLAGEAAAIGARRRAKA